MKTVFYICSLITVMLMSASQSEAGLHDLHMEFSYTPPQGKSVINFYIYCNGIRVPNVTIAPHVYSLDFILNTGDVNLISDNVTANFTLTAMLDDNSESPHSPGYSFTLSKPFTLSIPQGFQFGSYEDTFKIPTQYSYKSSLEPRDNSIEAVLTKIYVNLNAPA